MIPYIYRKRPTIKRKKEVLEGMIVDTEIEIETMWMMYKDAQGKLEGIKDKIKANLDEIDKEKAKEQIDLAKIKDLQKENFNLGYDRRDGKEIKYQAKGTVSLIENQIERHMAEISDKVLGREHLKLKLQATNILIKRGAQKSFEEFRDKELTFVLK